MSRFLLLALAAAPLIASPLAAHAQLASADRSRAMQLLTLDCGMDDALASFRQGMLALGGAAQPLLLQVLQEGAPREVRRAEERNFGRSHADMQAAMRNPEFSSIVAGAALPERSAFVADGLRRLDVKYRGNAVRGLGLVGGADAIAPLQRAAQANPDLATAAAAATAEITARGTRN